MKNISGKCLDVFLSTSCGVPFDRCKVLKGVSRSEKKSADLTLIATCLTICTLLLKYGFLKYQEKYI